MKVLFKTKQNIWKFLSKRYFRFGFSKRKPYESFFPNKKKNISEISCKDADISIWFFYKYMEVSFLTK